MKHMSTKVSVLAAIMALAIAGVVARAHAGAKNAKLSPEVAAAATVVKQQMKRPAVIAEAQRMVDRGLFTVRTVKGPSNPTAVSIGGCGFLQACVFFNRTEQRYIATGAGAAVELRSASQAHRPRAWWQLR